jgi:hypothetical protein
MTGLEAVALTRDISVLLPDVFSILSIYTMSVTAPSSKKYKGKIGAHKVWKFVVFQDIQTTQGDPK